MAVTEYGIPAKDQPDRANNPSKDPRVESERSDISPTERALRASFRGSPVGIVVLNGQGEIQSINPAALEVFDLDRDRIVTTSDEGKPTRFLDILPEDQQSRWDALIRLATGGDTPLSESRFHHRSRYLEKVLSLKIAPCQDERGGPGVIITTEDVTEKVTTEQYVILSEKLVARGEMAALVVHELNNYLSVIANTAELLSMHVERNQLDKVKFNTKSIIDNVFKIKSFAAGLMQHAKPEPEFISYDIRHLIDDLLFSLRTQPRFRQVHFTIDLSEYIPYVEMDVGQIQQVLLNLLQNASDSLELRAARLAEQGREFKREIGIAASYDEDFEIVTVEVSDNGVGMTPDVLGKIFSLHFTTKKGGHGLGLYNCRLIVNQHGGELQAESQPNMGATMVITLPRFQSKPASKRE